MDSPHSIFHTSHFKIANFKFRSTQYTPHATRHTLHSTLYPLRSTLYSWHSTLYTQYSTLNTLHSTLDTLHYTITLYAVHPTVELTLHTLFTLYTLHSTAWTSPRSTLHCLQWYSSRGRVYKTVAMSSWSVFTWCAVGFGGWVMCFWKQKPQWQIVWGAWRQWQFGYGLVYRTSCMDRTCNLCAKLDS